ALVNVLGLVAKKTGALNQLLQPLDRQGGQRGRSCVFGKQLLGDDVDSLIGALRRQDGCDEQLKRRVVDKRALRVRKFALQQFHDLTGVLLALRGCGWHRAATMKGKTSWGTAADELSPRYWQVASSRQSNDEKLRIDAKDRCL